MGIQITVIDRLQPLGEGERMPAGHRIAMDSADNSFTGVEVEDAPAVSWTAVGAHRWNVTARELEPELPCFGFFQLYRQDEISGILEKLRSLDGTYLDLSGDEAESFSSQTEQLIAVFEYASKLPEAGVSVS